MTDKTVTYEFDGDTSTEIVSCMMWDQEFLRRTDGLIEPTYFSNPIEYVFATLTIEHYRKYGENPTKTVWVELIKKAIASKMLRDDQKSDAALYLINSGKLTVRNRAWLLDSIAEFAKQQAMTNTLFGSAKELLKLSDPTRFERVEKMMREAMQVALHIEDDDYDLIEKIEERTQERLLVASGGAPKTGITTGVKELDGVLMHGGWGKKEMSILMGGAKASKSFHLSFFAVNAALDGKNVLFVTLENSVPVVAMRMDAQLSKIKISEQFTSPHAMKAGVVAAGAAPRMGKIKIRYRDADVFTPANLQRLIDEYKAKGIIFDLLVIDYLDLMAPDHRTNEPRENSRLTWVGARRVAANENMALLSATQTNRAGHSSATVKAEHVAEDFNKIRTADLVLSINRTDDEKAASKARITFAASRNQADGATLFVSQDLDLGMAISEVDSVE